MINPHSIFKIVLVVGLMYFSTSSYANVEKGTVSINKKTSLLTMMNVFKPKSGTQDEVLAAIDKGLREQVSKLPGFVNATIHRSLDNDYIFVYAQWLNQASVDAAVLAIQSGGAPDMMRAFMLATPDFHPYRVEAIYHASERKE